MAGNGGSIWGANGGGVTPVGAPAQVKQTLSTGQRKANSLIGGANPSQSVLSNMSSGALSGQAADSSLPAGGGSAG